MRPLNNLPEIVFVSSDASEIEKTIFDLYTSLTGRTLAQGDPVRLFLMCITNIVVLLMNNINETGKQNLLRYAAGNNLDHLGALVGTERLLATAAKTTMIITLSAAQDSAVIIPAGTRIAVNGNTDIYFAIDELQIIQPGETTIEADATCLQSGVIGNGFGENQINVIVDPVPFVKSITNITVSAGGADVETDDSYREAIHQAPESFSVAGPDGAYIYFAKRASALISDVAVFSPEPGTVQITPLETGGKIPESELLEIIEEAVNDRAVRPLTDKVDVVAPTAVPYNIDVTYYISKDDNSQANVIQENVKQAVEEFKMWQKEKLGRDINPSELIARMVGAGAKRVIVTEPEYKVLEVTQIAQESSVNVKLGGIENE